LPEEAMTRLLRARTEGDLNHPILLRLHRISEGNPLFALEIARALSGQGVRPAPGEPLPVPEDLQELLGARLGALPPSAADGLLVVAAAARPTEDLVAAATQQARRSVHRRLADLVVDPEEQARHLALATRRSVEAAGYHLDAGDAIRATALLDEAIATTRPGGGRGGSPIPQSGPNRCPPSPWSSS
jgi:hypothetical protein